MKFPVIFLCFVLFLVYLSFLRKRQTRRQDELNEAFLERERKANSTRRKDISNLDYLPFEAGRLPVSEYKDEMLSSCEEILSSLSGRKILNLSQYSNTDLKLMYGPANLNDLSEYDENYHTLSQTLYAYADREEELGRTDAAVSILEYAMELRIDSSRIYLKLAELYKKQETPEKIQAVMDAVSSMDETFASLVLPKLTSSQTP